MVGQDLDATQPRVLPVERRDAFQMLLRIIDPRQNRAAQNDRGAGPIKKLQIAQDEFISRAGPAQVRLRGSQFVVVKEQVNQRKQLRKILFSIMAGSIKAGVNVVFPSGAQQCFAEFKLQRGLSTAQSNAASRSVVR